MDPPRISVTTRRFELKISGYMHTSKSYKTHIKIGSRQQGKLLFDKTCFWTVQNYGPPCCSLKFLCDFVVLKIFLHVYRVL